MEDFVLFIKTYRKDFSSFLRLIKSIDKYNIDDLPVYVAVNDVDYNFFKKRLDGRIKLYKDSDLYNCKVKDGWRYQQIIKIQLYRLKKVENYLCLDSDSFFIKPFRKKDFFSGEKLYIIKHKSSDFINSMKKINKETSDLFFVNALLATRKVLNIPDKELWDYGPSPYLWNCKVWEDFFAFLTSINHTIESLFVELDTLYSPSENTLYGEFLSLTNNTNFIMRNELFKVYHYKEQYELEKNEMDSDYIKENYFGIILQSNWENKYILKLKNFFLSNYALFEKIKYGH